MRIERGRVGDELGARRGVGECAAVERGRHRAAAKSVMRLGLLKKRLTRTCRGDTRFPRSIVHPRRYVEFAASPRISNSVGPGYCSRS